ncbi:MAG: glycosyltransferase family 39 protein [Thermoplasmata archaeon]
MATSPLPRFRDRLGHSLPILLVLLVGAVAYTALAILQWSDLDEGVYLLAAVQVVHGQLPFVNFAGIEPGVPFYLSIGVWLFGPNLVIARLQLVLLVLATAFGIYLIGRAQHSRAAGLIGASVFLFSPLSLYYNSIVILEAASLAPLVFAAWILLGRRGGFAPRWALVVGALLGIAVLTRRDTAAFLPLYLLLGIYLARPGQRGQVAVGLVSGFVALAGGVLGYFAVRTSVASMYTQYGFGAAYARNVVPLPYHFGSLAYGVLTLPAMAIGLVGTVAWLCETHGLARLSKWAVRLTGLPLVFVLLYGINYQSWGQGESFFSDAALAFAAVLVGGAILRLESVDLPSLSGARDRTTVPFLLAWLAWLLIFYTVVYPEFFIHYLIEFSAPVSLLAGIFLAARIGRWIPHASSTPTVLAGAAVGAHFEHRTRRMPSGDRFRTAPARAIMIALALAVPSAVGGLLILGPTNPYNSPYLHELKVMNLNQRVYPAGEIQQVANYLDARTSANETVFTADCVFAAVANRPVLLDLSTLIDDYAYPAEPLRMDQSPLGPASIGVAPTLSEIFSAWNRTYVPFVVVGNRTLSMESVTPYLEIYLLAHYHTVATFDPELPSQAVAIEALGAVAGSPTLGGTIASGPRTSAAVIDPANGVTYLADSSNDSLEIRNASGTHYRIDPVPETPGVSAMLLSPSNMFLVAAAGTSTLVEYSVGGSGMLTVAATLGVTGPVSAIAFDLNSSSLFALAPSAAQVLEINTSSFTTTRTYSVLSKPSALSAGPGPDEIVVASGQHPKAIAYNLTTGAVAQTYQLHAIADHIAVTGRLLVATEWSAPEAVWLNATTGALLAVDTTGRSSEGFDIAGGLVFVSGYLDGLVTIFSATDGDPEGFVPTGTCAASLSYDPASQLLIAAGPCAPGAEVWSLGAPAAYPILSPNGTNVFLDGLKELDPARAELFDGGYALEAIRGGWSSLTTVLVTGPGSVHVDPPDLSSALETDQIAFTVLVVLGLFCSVAGLGLLAARRPEFFVPEFPRERIE